MPVSPRARRRCSSSSARSSPSSSIIVSARTSRARCAAPWLTITSRGPLAKKSGLSKPKLRLRMLAIPASASSPCSISASTWLRAKATLTSLPSPPPPPPPPSSPPPESPPPPWAPRLWALPWDLCDVEVDIGDLHLLQRVGLHIRRLAVLERDDQVDLFGPHHRLVDVRLRRVGGAAGVGVVDTDQLVPRAFDLFQRIELPLRVHLVAERAGSGVLDPHHTRRLPVPAADHPAALVRQILARVRDHLADQLLRDLHEARLADTGLFHRPAIGPPGRLRLAVEAEQAGPLTEGAGGVRQRLIAPGVPVDPGDVPAAAHLEQSAIGGFQKNGLPHRTLHECRRITAPGSDTELGYEQGHATEAGPRHRLPCFLHLVVELRDGRRVRMESGEVEVT